MKNKIRVIFLCLMMTFALTGCQLAIANADRNRNEDKLAGVFITTEYLDLFDTEKYQGRIYANRTAKTPTEFTFPIDGFAFFSAIVPESDGQGGYVTSIADSAISDRKVEHKKGDDGNTTAMSGTIYVSSSGIDRNLYANPVYQSADGGVYLTAGTGMTASMESEGASISYSIKSATTVAENGKAKEESTSITLSLTTMLAPEKIDILQMDAENAILSQTEYTPEAMPKSITAEAKTAYFIIETHKRANGEQMNVSREIVDRDVERIETFYKREDGVCVKRWTEIK